MLLSLEHIHKGFGNPGDASYRPVLNDLSLQVDEGENIAILGPSGSGKTTLLNLVGGLDSPDQGRVLFRGTDITGYTNRQIDGYRNREIGFVFQFHHLLPQCTLLENVLIPTLIQSLTNPLLVYGSDHRDLPTLPFLWQTLLRPHPAQLQKHV